MKNKCFFAGIVSILLILGLILAGCGDNSDPSGSSGNNPSGTNSGGGDITVTFSGVTANGSSSQTTTQLTLIFSQTITGLSASDITLSGVSGVNKGTLSGSGPTYTLGISGVSSGGTLTVVVSKSGYVISGSPKTTTIYYYYSPPNINPLGTPTLSATRSGNNITIKWSFPTGNSYGSPTSIDVRLQHPSNYTWVTVETLPGTATSYTFNYTAWCDSLGQVIFGIIGRNSYSSMGSIGLFNTNTGVLD